MSARDPRCNALGHAFVPWSNWVPVMQPIEVISPTVDVAPEYQPPEAYRERGCARCGMIQLQDYQGNITDCSE